MPKLSKLSKQSCHSLESMESSLRPLRSKTVQQRQTPHHFQASEPDVLLDTEVEVLRRVQVPLLKKNYCRRKNTLKKDLSAQNQRREVHGSQLKTLDVIGVFDNKIILCYSNKLRKFAFVDQHAMHERIRYEFYMGCLKEGSQEESISQSNIFAQASKRTLWDRDIIEKHQKNPFPVISAVHHSYLKFNVNSEFQISNRSIFSQQLEDAQYQSDLQHNSEIGSKFSIRSQKPLQRHATKISKYGFKVVYIENVLKIDQIPSIMGRKLDNRLIVNIAMELVADQWHVPKSLDETIAELSCKNAFKFNDKLSRDQCKRLIENLSLCKYPFHCIHGRPTVYCGDKRT